jgi:hypothetical protein
VEEERERAIRERVEAQMLKAQQRLAELVSFRLRPRIERHWAHR